MYSPNRLNLKASQRQRCRPINYKLISRNSHKPTEPNYDDLLNLDTFTSSIPAPKVEPEQVIAQNPEPVKTAPAETKDPYGNFDLLDDITPMTQDVAKPVPSNPVQNNQTKDNILDFGLSNPTQNNPPPPSNTNDFNLDIFGGDSSKPAPVEEKKTAQITMDADLDLFGGKAAVTGDVSSPTIKEPEFLADDTEWLTERDLDSSGRNGIKIFGKWFLKLKSKLFLRITIWNKSQEAYRSPRLDIKDNYYGVLFLKDGVGVPLQSLNPGEFVTLEKGIVRG